jgi:uncharacterized protein
MPLLVDTGVLYAYYDRRDPWHERAKVLLDEEEALVLPTPVIPEADYLLGRRVGLPGCLAFYDDITAGVYFLTELTGANYERVLELNRQYTDLKLGFVDAAIIAVAETLDIPHIATIDRRHFAAVKAKVPLVLLP